MRHNQNRRSRSRSRKGPNPLTRSFESNGPDVKVRGTAPHVAEKYMSLARDAQSSGDIVAAENYLQHAEHYNRIVMAAQAQLQQERQAQFGGSEEVYEDDRQMNGRGVRDRFESNVSQDDEEGDDRFDSSEEEQERSFEPPRQQQQPRMNDRNDRNASRGPRPERYDRGQRPDGRPDGRNEGRPDQRPDGRNEYRGDGRNDGRNDRNDRGDRPRFDRPDDRGDQRGDRGGNEQRPERSGNEHRAERSHEQRPERNGHDRPRFDRPDDRGERNIGRDDRNDRPERAATPPDEREMRVGVATDGAADVEPAAAAPDLPLDETPAPVRKRRGRPPRVDTGVATAAGDSEVTPDGAAALVAFPD